MKHKLQEIKSEYDKFYASLMKQGKLPMKDTGIGFWNAAIAEEAYEAFKKLRLDKHRAFLDLGSGDGKVVLIASLFGVRAEGVEIDTALHGKAIEMQKKLGIFNAVFHNKNYFDHDIKDYDFVFVNPDQPMYRGLESKLLKELSGKLVVYGHHFCPGQLKKTDSFTVNGNLVGVYRNE